MTGEVFGVGPPPNTVVLPVKRITLEVASLWGVDFRGFASQCQPTENGVICRKGLARERLRFVGVLEVKSEVSGVWRPPKRVVLPAKRPCLEVASLWGGDFRG